MKKLNLVSLILILGTLSIFAQKSAVKVNVSTVEWTGHKIGGAHNGEIQIKSGEFDFKNGNITDGTIVIDMNSITCSDLENKDYNKKLVDHLKSEDFFGTTKYPTATFTVTQASDFKDEKAKVTGNLTIKGKTEPITFDVTKKGMAYSAQLKVDRSKYDVRYGSKSFFDNLGDKTIDDIFILDIKIAL